MADMSNVSGERPLLQSVIALTSASVLGAGGLLLGFALLVVTIAGITFVLGTTPSQFAFLVLSLVFVQGIGCAGVALSYYKLRPALAPRVRSLLDLAGDGEQFGLPAAVPSLRQAAVVLGGYAAAIVWVMLSGVLLTVIQNLRGERIQTGNNAAAELGQSNPELLLLLIPASVLLIGPGEELLFRGVVQGRLRERFSPAVGIAIASVIFAGLHIFALVGGSWVGNLVVVSILFGTSTVFGIAYEYAENVVVPSLIHGLYNATLFTVLYVSLALGDELQQGALMGLAG